MTEDDIRAVFFKNYAGGDLNEELIICLVEIDWTIVKKLTQGQERFRPDDIINTVLQARSRMCLFEGIEQSAERIIPDLYFDYFDFVLDAVAKVASFLIDNYETLDSWFRTQVPVESLESTRKFVTEKIDEKRYYGNRSFLPREVLFYSLFLNGTLAAIFGKETVNEIIREHNEALPVLKMCGDEALALNNLDPNKTAN